MKKRSVKGRDIMKHNEFIILDGAMGTVLQAAGLPAGALPETWNLLCPEVVVGIQKQYVESGSNVIFANTFGANRLKLSDSGYSVAEVVSAGIAVAKKAAEGTDTKVALDIGPLGQLLAPLGMLRFDEAYDIFREMLVAGEEAGADLVIFETMGDLREIKAGVLAAKEHTKLPIWTTMTYEKSGRTFVGVSVPTMALTLSSLGVEAMGFNCSLGPRELMTMVAELAKWTDKPIILKPNAGLPDSTTGTYTITPEEFIREVKPATELGVYIFGGCCGTGPKYIEALKQEFADMVPVERENPCHFGVSSASVAVEFDDLDEIGRTISPENPEVQEAVEDEDFDTLCDLAMEDMDEEAEVIQVFLPEEGEAEALPQAVQEIQAVVNAPLLLRAHSAEALEKALRVYNGRPMAVADSPEKEMLCEKYGAVPVKLTEDGEYKWNIDSI